MKSEISLKDRRQSLLCDLPILVDWRYERREKVLAPSSCCSATGLLGLLWQIEREPIGAFLWVTAKNCLNGLDRIFRILNLAKQGFHGR